MVQDSGGVMCFFFGKGSRATFERAVKGVLFKVMPAAIGSTEIKRSSHHGAMFTMNIDEQ